MKDIFNPGDRKTYIHVVSEADTARFDSGEVHSVYSTFALARDAEWCGRLFVLEMKDDDEEGIGTGLNIIHQAPAFLKEEVTFTAVLEEVNKNEVIVDYTAMVGTRLVGHGKTWQKILKKEKLEKIFHQPD